MSIWVHSHNCRDRELIERIGVIGVCVHCGCDCELLKSEFDKSGIAGVNLTGTTYELTACPVCGWWKASGSKGRKTFREYIIDHYMDFGILLPFDVSDKSAPINEAFAFLSARYESRHQFHPRLFEETVASVFRGLGYQPQVTAYQKDGGIDIVLVGKDEKQIGVQVKRHKKKITVSQIRELVGVIVLKGYAKGIIVTTSSYTGPAVEEAATSTAIGVPIELLDAKGFLDALNIARRKRFTSKEDFEREIGRPSLRTRLSTDRLNRF